MKTLSKSGILIFASIVGSMLISSSVFADYRVTAFGDTKGYTALMGQDAETAMLALDGGELTALDFEEINNLCVAQILSSELEAAIATCASALVKVETALYLSATSEKSAKASIYSNLAVAKALSGDVTAASEDLEKALFFNRLDANASSNYSLVRDQLQPAELAQGI